MSALDVSDVGVSFGDHPVLAGLNLSVPTGSLVAVLGPSGSGKTTLLRAIAGFLRPDAGTISIDGSPVVSNSIFLPAERRRVGYVPQEGALFPHLDVAGNIAFGLGRHKRTERVNELLDLVGLRDLATRKPHELSGGQQQRVALARALAPSPSLILLDEPFAALDGPTRLEVRDEVRRVLRASGATALLVTHDRDEALGWADLVAVVDNGRIVQVGTPVDVYLHPTSLAVARAVGETVEIPAVVGEEDGKRISISELGRTPVLARNLNGTSTGESRTLMMRPAQFRLAREDEEGGTGVVLERYFTGEFTEITVLLPSGRSVHAHLPEAPENLVPGASARLTTRGSGLLL
jgi:iron(III) transport system ATP-binding protein